MEHEVTGLITRFRGEYDNEDLDIGGTGEVDGGSAMNIEMECEFDGQISDII